MSDEKSGYWGVGNSLGFRGTAAHWWLPGEGKDTSLCGIAMRPINIDVPWRSQRCKRCEKSLIAMQELEDEK